ncbi:MAG TPA: hypothetical protein VGR61_01095 [Candidatus Dormibacteraeota bacterium]|nr:hypothetical protein [Candidatus Dormibacteraeota bacterium]
MINDPATSVEPATLQVAPAQALVVPPRAEPYARPVYAQSTNRRRWWTASLALAVLVTAGGLGLLYLDDHSFQNQAQSLTTDNESLQGQILGIQGELTATKGTLTTTQADLAAVRAELAHPNLGIWNVKQTLQGPSYYLAAGVPDTFTYHLRLKSTGAMNVSILSFDQFSAAVKCIENGAGDTNWCMHHSGTGTAYSQLGVTSVSYDFHQAEGCAAYMVVITAPGKVTITPDVSVTYNPASKATGTCA